MNTHTRMNILTQASSHETLEPHPGACERFAHATADEPRSHVFSFCLSVVHHLRLTVKRHAGPTKISRLPAISITRWTGFHFLTANPVRVPPAEVPHSCTLCLVCRNTLTHHNRGDRQVGPVKNVNAQSRRTYTSMHTHTHAPPCLQATRLNTQRGGDSILTRQFKPLFSLTTVLEDHNEQGEWWSPTKRSQHLKPSFRSVVWTTQDLSKGGVVYFWLKCVDVKSSRPILRVRDEEVYGKPWITRDPVDRKIHLHI